MTIRGYLLQLGRGFVSLLYPNLCRACETPIPRGTTPPLCLTCYGQLTPTGHWTLPENAATDRLLGRLDTTFAAGYLTFRVGTPTQALIHSLKYHREPEVGEFLGETYAEQLGEVPALQDLTGIVPVPIHPKRRRSRGYNQAEYIARGMAEVLDIPVFENALVRKSFKESQTRLTREERVENVRSSFAAGSGDFSGGHLLLVDDVLTTGATLDFCGNILLDNHPGLRVSIATLAITEN